MNPGFFLSHTLSEDTPGFGGVQGFSAEIVDSICSGKSSNSSRWILSNHIGTHIDVPFHFSNKGAKVDSYGAEFWIFKFPFLIDCKAEAGELITPRKWDSIVPKDCDMLLIRSGFQRFRADRIYWENNPGLSPEVGRWLRQHRPSIRAIGLDFLSVTCFQKREEGREAHRALLDPELNGTPLVVIEDMDLMHATDRISKVWVAPLRVKNADGTPVTIVGWD